MMFEHRVKLKPNRKQLIFLEAHQRHVAYGGARGGGKSWVIRVKAALLANRYGRPDPYSEGIKIVIIRRTRQDLIKNHLSQLQLMLRGIARYNQNDATFYFPNGATIHLAYCDNAKDAEHFQGVEYDVIFIEEATQLEEAWIKDIATSCRGVNNFPHRVYYTCNPGGPGHQYIKRLFVDRLFKDTEEPEDYAFIQAKVTDNDVLMKYSPEYVKFLKDLPPKRRAAWLEGSWEIYEGLYFNDFVNDPDHYEDRKWTHVIDPIRIRPHWPIYRGFDWGHYKPFATGWYAIDDDGVMYMIHELYGVMKSGDESLPDEGVQWPPEKVFRTIKEIEDTHPDLRGKKIIGISDPAIFKSETGESIAEMATRCGVYSSPGDNSRLAGWMQCRYRLQFDELGQPRFQVFRNCREFIRTIGTLQHDKTNVEDLDTKGEDHHADQWRYVCMARPIRAHLDIPEQLPAWGEDPLNQYEGRRRR